MKFDSFQSAVKAIKEISGRLPDSLVLDEQRVSSLRQYCSVFDKMLCDFCGENIEFAVDPDSLELIVTVIVENFTIDSPRRLVYSELLSRAVAVSFQRYDDDHLSIIYEFPSLWVLAG